MANKYQNSSQNKATKNLNQTHRTARQASNLEPSQTSSQNTRLASGIQRSISRLARRIKKAKPKLVLSLAFVVALPLIALGVFFGTGLNQEFGASAEQDDQGYVLQTTDSFGYYAGGIWGDGKFIYVANGENGIYVYAVNEEGKLDFRDKHDMNHPDDSGVRTISGDGKFIYVGNSRKSALDVYSVDNQGKLTHRSNASYAEYHSMNKVEGYGNFVIAVSAGYPNYYNVGIHVFSVDDDGQLTHKHTTKAKNIHDFKDISVRDGFVYTYNTEKTLHVYSINSSTGELTLIQEVEMNGYLYGTILRDGDYLYSSTNGGLEVYSVGNDGKVQYIQTYEQANQVRAIWANENYVYTGGRALKVFSKDGGGNLTYLTSYSRFNSSPTSVWADESFIYAGFNSNFSVFFLDTDEVRADNIRTITYDNKLQADPEPKSSHTNRCALKEVNYPVYHYLDDKDNDGELEKYIKSTLNTDSITGCVIHDLKGHTSGVYASPPKLNNQNTAIQIVARQGEGDNKIEKVGNCGVNDYWDDIYCMQDKTDTDLSNNPEKIDLKEFGDGIVEILLRLPKAFGSKTNVNDFEEIRLLELKVEAVDTSGCMNPDATNYDPNATEDDGSCKYSKTIPYKKCVGGFIIPDTNNPGEYIKLPDTDGNGIPEWNPEARPYCELRTTTPEASPKVPT
jgi:6-phosphogluconolactonase (cycloisomerase 2 family)